MRGDTTGSLVRRRTLACIALFVVAIAASCTPNTPNTPPTSVSTVVVPAGAVTVFGPTNSVVTISPVNPSSLPPKPSGLTFLFGALAIDVRAITPGSVANLTVTLARPVTAVRKLVAGVWDPFTFDGTTGATLSPDGRTITLAIQDGGRGDADGLANGQIVDPLAPATAAVTAVKISGNGWETCVLTDTGAVNCWGQNAFGALGDGTTVASSSVPVSVVGITGATDIGVGAGFACAITAAATVQCWGDGESGQLGDGLRTSSNVPVDVVGLSDVAQLTVGADHSCAVTSSGSVYCWGSNFSRESAPDLTDLSVPIPRAVSVPPFTKIVAGAQLTCVLLIDTTVSCWGISAWGVLGRPQQLDPLPLGLVTGVTGVTDLDSSLWYSSCAAVGSNVRCFGYNAAGLGGTGSVLPTGIETPTILAMPAAVAEVATGFDEACARLADATVSCWGDNADGSLGRGDTTLGPVVPGLVPGLTGVTGIATGSSNVCVLLAGGSVSCWGLNDRGQLGLGNTTNQSSPVALPWFG